jgi:hypothetical protein
VIFAHAGHWVAALPFFGPVLVLSGGLVALRLGDGRRRRRAEGPPVRP